MRGGVWWVVVGSTQLCGHPNFVLCWSWVVTLSKIKTNVMLELKGEIKDVEKQTYVDTIEEIETLMS